jgi:predicted peptidase
MPPLVKGSLMSSIRTTMQSRVLLVALMLAIEPGRLYVTGISMGCYGIWDTLMRSPGVFAAASTQSCRGDPDVDLLAALKDMPI